ncbi:type IX secretion system membrane protein, PorP/SprF family [Chryseolinea serpens]|uniref:Type IX secretion system membrane protein, PorP/SprF family n=1 Tax=Chryseolinea serpens TaxID=947013 RepID=A0A1M5L190_9BACT|nr:type IX secretion system membrane protein PorP/SprF [Chryseolinea serpens]SHG58761.1 type IX secretion system membrane protein, PorP/SprF family [Chryseolinea serpens]
MKHFLPGLLLFVALLPAHAQEDPLYAQYLNNPLVINPAYSGLNRSFNAAVTYRRQWGGFDGAPSTGSLTAHTALADNKMGAGLVFVRDKSGNTNNTEALATYAYRISGGGRTLSFGLQGGFINYKIMNSELNPYDPADPAFASNQSITRPSVGAGLIFSSERFFLGLSAPRLLKAEDTSGDVTARLYSQHYYFMGAYVFHLNERVRFKPSVLFKGVKGAPFSTDYNAAINLDERYTAALFTRNFNTYGFLAQIRLGDLYRLGYAFEVPTNSSVGTRFTTHEFSFGVNLAFLKSHETTVTNF